jgi:hypothetical protein
LREKTEKITHLPPDEFDSVSDLEDVPMEEEVNKEKATAEHIELIKKACGHVVAGSPSHSSPLCLFFFLVFFCS